MRAKLSNEVLLKRLRYREQRALIQRENLYKRRTHIRELIVDNRKKIGDVKKQISDIVYGPNKKL